MIAQMFPLMGSQTASLGHIDAGDLENLITWIPGP